MIFLWDDILIPSLINKTIERERCCQPFGMTWMRDTSPWSHLQAHMWTQTILTWYTCIKSIKKQRYPQISIFWWYQKMWNPRHGYPNGIQKDDNDPTSANLVVENHSYKERAHEAHITYGNFLWNPLGVPHDPHFFAASFWEMRCSLGVPMQILCATKFKPLFVLQHGFHSSPKSPSTIYSGPLGH